MFSKIILVLATIMQMAAGDPLDCTTISDQFECVSEVSCFWNAGHCYNDTCYGQATCSGTCVAKPFHFVQVGPNPGDAPTYSEKTGCVNSSNIDYNPCALLSQEYFGETIAERYCAHYLDCKESVYTFETKRIDCIPNEDICGIAGVANCSLFSPACRVNGTRCEFDKCFHYDSFGETCPAGCTSYTFYQPKTSVANCVDSANTSPNLCYALMDSASETPDTTYCDNSASCHVQSVSVNFGGEVLTRKLCAMNTDSPDSPNDSAGWAVRVPLTAAVLILAVLVNRML